MIIALDYDGTYTAAPVLWDNFISCAISATHKIICITMRKPEEKISNMPINIPIYYTSRQAKAVWARENGIAVDIWIDDKPAWLFEDAIR